MAPLKALRLASLTPRALEYLEHRDIVTVEDFVSQELGEINDSEVDKAVAEINSYLARCHSAWESGADMLDKVHRAQHLSTGVESLDCLLRGGWRDGTITELVGASSSGKTQVCMHAAASVAYTYKAPVAYVDVSCSFSSERVLQILNGKVAAVRSLQTDVKEAMQRISCFKVYSVHDLLDVLHSIKETTRLPHQDPLSVRLVIVDCPAFVLSPILGGSNVQGHALMMSVCQILKRIATENNITVLTTNNTVASEDEEMKPALGESWKSVPHVRLALDKDHEKNSCTATLIKHTSMACNTQVTFSFDRG